MKRKPINVSSIKTGQHVRVIGKVIKGFVTIKEGWVVSKTTTHVKVFSPYDKHEGHSVDHPDSCELFAVNGQRVFIELKGGVEQ